MPYQYDLEPNSALDQAPSDFFSMMSYGAPFAPIAPAMVSYSDLKSTVGDYDFSHRYVGTPASNSSLESALVGAPIHDEPNLRASQNFERLLTRVASSIHPQSEPSLMAFKPSSAVRPQKSSLKQKRASRQFTCAKSVRFDDKIVIHRVESWKILNSDVSKGRREKENRSICQVF